MLVQMLSSYATGSWRGVEEAAVALVVGVIMLAWARTVPNWDWETFEWREMVRFVLCIATSYGIFASICYGGLEIPGMEPACGIQGAFNAAIVAFLAFLVNDYAEDKAMRFIESIKSRKNK